MLDDRDRRLLALLQTDADLGLSELAERLALSPSACSRRIQRLREAGYIRRTVAVLDRAHMGVPTTLFVLARCGRHAPGWMEAFSGAAGGIPEIVEVHRLTGTYDYLLKLVLPNVEHYDTVYKALLARVEFAELSAFISMETVKAETAVPVTFAR